MEENVFSDDEISRFVTHFLKNEFNQFAYVVIDKVFEDYSEEKRIYFREKCLASFEEVTSEKQISADATEVEKAEAAAVLAANIYVKINKMVDDGDLVMPSDED